MFRASSEDGHKDARNMLRQCQKSTSTIDNKSSILLHLVGFLSSRMKESFSKSQYCSYMFQDPLVHQFCAYWCWGIGSINMQRFLCRNILILTEVFIIKIIIIYLTAVSPVAQSVWRLTTGWKVRDRISVRTRFSARPDWPWGAPSLPYNGYRVFPGGRGGRGMELTRQPHLMPKGLRKG